MSDATCKTCPYWSPYPARDDSEFRGDMGDCRRHAPTMVAVRAEDPRDPADFNSLFPYTVADEWCGEHPGRAQCIGGTTEIATAALTEDDVKRIVKDIAYSGARSSRAAV
ncbi:MAG TPA: hypothetical protein VFE45_09670 [Coriobacteriia bacterium]|nr:hypothetical protein [Coriobacteriia bacterium]